MYGSSVSSVLTSVMELMTSQAVVMRSVELEEDCPDVVVSCAATMASTIVVVILWIPVRISRGARLILIRPSTYGSSVSEKLSITVSALAWRLDCSPDQGLLSLVVVPLIMPEVLAPKNSYSDLTVVFPPPLTSIPPTITDSF